MDYNQESDIKVCSICKSTDLDIAATIYLPDKFERYVSKKYGLQHKPREWLLCRVCNAATQLIDRDILCQLQNISDKYYKIDFGNSSLKERQLKILSLPHDKSDNQNRVTRIVSFMQSQLISSPFKGKKLKILDFGSGLGVFPIVLKDYLDILDINHEIHLVETDPHAVKLLSELPMVLHAGKYNSKHHRNYNFISLNKVLEHLSDPVTWIKLLSKSLAKGGCMYIEVPSIECLKGDLNSPALGSLHMNLYSINTFKFIIKLTNLEITSYADIIDPSGKRTCYAFFTSK